MNTGRLLYYSTKNVFGHSEAVAYNFLFSQTIYIGSLQSNHRLYLEQGSESPEKYKVIATLPVNSDKSLMLHQILHMLFRFQRTPYSQYRLERHTTLTTPAPLHSAERRSEKALRDRAL